LDMLKKTNYDAYIENELGVRMQVSIKQTLFPTPNNCCDKKSLLMYQMVDRLTSRKDVRNRSGREVSIARHRSPSGLKHLNGMCNVS
jgi:hypothetical protein